MSGKMTVGALVDAGGEATYVRKVSDSLTLMAGTDYNRDAPRRDDLDRYLSTDPAVYGPFEKVTANNVTIGDIAPFLAIGGSPWPWLHYYAGWRRDEIGMDNQDTSSPKASRRFSRRAWPSMPAGSCSSACIT
jgi:hypothetical protein